MAPSPASAALALTAFAVLIAGTWCWLIVAAKAAVSWRLLSEPIAAHISEFLTSHGISPRLPLVAWSPRRPVMWSFVDLVAITGLYIVAGAALHESGLIPGGKIETLTLAEKQTVMAANAVLSLCLVLASVVWVVVRCGATSGDLGWSWSEVQGDLRLGLLGFVMLAPPVYGLQGLLVSFWKKSEHPIIEMFKDGPDPAFFGLLFISAALVAPLVEELMFRVLLQGFLEKAVRIRSNPTDLLFGVPNCTAAKPATSAPLPIDDNAYALPQELISSPPLAISELSEDQPELRGLLAWLPIGISSTIFALLHYSHGPDWVPLLILAAGMGYLYQRTHRLLPSLVVHTSLNALSMWGLWVQVHDGLGPK